MIEILYDCPLFTVAVKPAGFLSEEGEGGFPDLLKKQLSLPRLYPVHRLDRVVSGVMVCAKTPQAAAELSKEHALEKTYLTVLKGVGLPPVGELNDLLFKDSKNNKTYVVNAKRKGVREATLSYRVLEENAEKGVSLVFVTLQTGRSHQIRAQFSHRKHPVLGDGKYGGSDNAVKNIALFSRGLRFFAQGKGYTFSALPPNEYPWNLFPLQNFEG